MMESNPYFSGRNSYCQSYGNSHFESSAYSGSNGYCQSYVSGYTGNSSYTRSPAMLSFPVVRLRGLPFSCTIFDVSKFFAGLDVVDILLLKRNGLFSGDAYVVFASPMQAEIALGRNRRNMGHWYVEVFRSWKKDYYFAITDKVNSIGAVDKDLMEFTEILKLRGLPYSTTKREIVDFFSGFELNEDNAHIVLRPDGKATGEAFAEFASADEAKKAMSKDRMNIGSRYVELFPSSPEDVELSNWR